VFIGGLLVVRKIQRFDLVLSFMAAAAITIIALNPSLSLGNALQRIFIHTSVLFFGFIMITEPLTTPPTRWLRVAYGAIVGFLFAPGLHFGTLYYSSPELALVIGNIFSYIVSPKRKYLLKLTSKTAYGTDIYDFAFTGAGVMKFSPGQYMEWTINGTGADSRGNRRYFTIASSPTEKEIHLGVKFYKPSSTFKEKMLALKSGDTLLGGQLAGDFTLPHDTTKKLVFVAGGIGITPFRSMAKYLSDRGEKRDVVLLYSNRLVSEITYAETFDEAEKTIGMKTIYAITDTKESSSRKIHNGRIDAALIKREIPDYQNRIYYLSGPRGMVMAFEKTLSELGVPLTHIKIDFFPGFA
jgi:ferredoxin-NADP reductase